MYFTINKNDYCQTYLCILCSREIEFLFRVGTIQTILTGSMIFPLPEIQNVLHIRDTTLCRNIRVIFIE